MDARLPFGTPEILAVEYVNGTPVTYERKLPGQPLQDQLAVEAHAVAPAAARCVIDVLQALAAVPASTAMRQLAVLDEGQPLWAGAQTFRAALMNLLRRRVARFGPPPPPAAGVRPLLRRPGRPPGDAARPPGYRHPR
jgi:hypothetical protein